MKIEVLVYIYLYLCVCVILFDFIYVMRNKLTKWFLEYRIRRYATLIRRQLMQIDRKGAMEPRAQWALTKELCAPSQLIAFVEAITRLRAEKPRFLDDYLGGMASYFLYLAYRYQNMSPEYRAYFAYVVAMMEFGRREMELREQTDRDTIGRIMLSFLSSESVYVRENACKAIYSIGNESLVLAAVEALNQAKGFLNGKLLNEGLLSFAGDHAPLIRHLLERLDHYVPALGVVIIDYCRLLPYNTVDQSSYYEPLYRRLVAPKVDKEVRLALIRYFRRYPYEPVRATLLELVARQDEQDWEFAAVAASALWAYPGEETLQTLKEAVSSSNWYIRFNAAESLIGLGLDYSALVTENMDAYAQGMLLYRSEISRLKGKSRAKVC